MPRPSAPVGILSTTRPLNGVDPRDAALFRARHPDRSAADGEGGRRHADRNRLHLAVRLRVDPRHRAVQRVRHPDRAGADRDPARIAADVDALDDALRPGVDARDGARPARSSPTPPLRRRRCSSGLPTGNCRPRADSTFASIAATEFAEAELRPARVRAGELDAGHGDRRRQDESGADRDQDAAAAPTSSERARRSATRFSCGRDRTRTAVLGRARGAAEGVSSSPR